MELLISKGKTKVKSVREGLAADAFNKMNPDLAIQSGDWIVLANEASSPEQITKEFQEAEAVELTLERR